MAHSGVSAISARRRALKLADGGLVLLPSAFSNFGSSKSTETISINAGLRALRSIQQFRLVEEH